jgi:hypothetical protein
MSIVIMSLMKEKNGISIGIYEFDEKQWNKYCYNLDQTFKKFTWEISKTICSFRVEGVRFPPLFGD